MSNETESLMLKAVLEQYATPDPRIVGKITKNGVDLDFVGHAEITRILIEIDPMWNWQPAAWIDGKPAIQEVNGVATMWGNLTLLGKTVIGVGTANTIMTTRAGEKFAKPDYSKELIGDFLRNAAMRFGICLSLWSRQDKDQAPASSPTTFRQVADAFPGSTMVQSEDASGKSVATKATPARQASAGNPISDKQVFLINKLSKENNISNFVTFAAEIVGREVSAINALNSREASQIIDRLMTPQPVLISHEAEEPF